MPSISEREAIDYAHKLNLKEIGKEFPDYAKVEKNHLAFL